MPAVWGKADEGSALRTTGDGSSVCAGRVHSRCLFLNRPAIRPVHTVEIFAIRWKICADGTPPHRRVSITVRVSRLPIRSSPRC
jgi:hypothetical protein